VGEIVRALPQVRTVWSGEVLIVVPQAAVATVAFYKSFRARYPHLPEVADNAMEQVFTQGFSGLPLSLIENDFEPVVREICPEVGIALDQARRFFPESTSLAGSGSAIFSLVPVGEEATAEACCAVMRSEGMTVHRAQLLGDAGQTFLQ
jgi:4-diphosphocytidyl-2C-methyl-D-erythritol kinase